jgi:hypothetical protein
MRVLGLLAMMIANGTPAAAQSSAAGVDIPAWAVAAELRLQYENFLNEEWGEAPSDPDGYLLQRYQLQMRRRLGSSAVAVVGLKSGIETGRAGGPRPADADLFDVHEAFVDVRLTRSASVRAGRQELQFGSSRLLSVRDLNVRQSFDAGRLILHTRAWRIDLFGGWPAATLPGALDDRSNRRRGVWGAYAVRGVTGGVVEAYYIGYWARRAEFEGGAGTEQRHSFGVRWAATRNRVDHDLEVVAQAGRLDAFRIRAWTIASDTGLLLDEARRTRVGLRADVTSGDADSRDRNLGTFNAMFPRGGYFGLIATAGPANHLDVHPQVSRSVTSQLTIAGGALWFWRSQVADAIYNVPGGVLRGAGGSHARFVGWSPSLTVTMTFNRHASLSSDLSMFTAGAFLRQIGPHATTRFFGLTFTYRL